MRPKSGENCPMSSAEMTTLARSSAAAWVEREERRTGSRMVAYEIVAQSVGASADWIRRFITDRDRAKEPSLTVGWNILTLYRRVCDRVDLKIENERAMQAALARQIDAATQQALDMVARVPEAKASGNETEADARPLTNGGGAP